MQPTTSVDARPDEHVHAAVLGDIAALAWLYERYADSLRRWLEAKTRNRELADDLAQNTWVKVAANIGSYDAAKARGGFEAWLWTIARNEVTEQGRRQGRQRETLTAEMLDHDVSDSAESPEAAAQRSSESARLTAELQALPEAQSTCLIHRFYAGLSLAETAAVMGKSVGAIKVLQFRAIKALNRALPDLDPVAVFAPSVQAVADSRHHTPMEVRR